MKYFRYRAGSSPTNTRTPNLQTHFIQNVSIDIGQAHHMPSQGNYCAVDPVAKGLTCISQRALCLC